MRTSRLDFSGAQNIINPEAELAKAFQQTGSNLNQMITQSAEKRRAEEALKQQALQNQMAREGMDLRKQGMTLQEQEAVRRAQQAETANAMDAAKMQMTSEYQQENLRRMADAQKAKEAQDRFVRGQAIRQNQLQEGEILGKAVPIEAQTMQDKTVSIPTADASSILKQEADKLKKGVGYTPSEMQKSYEEYLQKEDPKAYEEYTRKVTLLDKGIEQGKRNIMAVPTLVGSGVMSLKEALMPKSRADIDTANISVPTAPGVKTREEFFQGLKAQEAQTKKEVEEFVKTDKEYAKTIGAIEDKVTKTAVRKDENTMRSDIDNQIRQYAEDNKLSMNHPKILGMYKTINDKVDKILTVREQADKQEIQRLYDKLDAQQKHQFDKDLLLMKQQFKGVLTPKDEAEMRKTLAEAKLKEQEVKDSKGWWD